MNMRAFWLGVSIGFAVVGVVCVLAAVAVLLGAPAAVLLGGVFSLYVAYLASTHADPLPPKIKVVGE